ncbi:MAG: hypothetical protein AB8B86_01080 [Pseudomonadales bacterium]
MSDTSHWDACRNRIRSRAGGFTLDGNVTLRGENLIQYIEDHSYFQTLMLAVTGRHVPRNIADWVEVLFSCLSYPDARIWCNNIAALGGDTKCSVVGATAAGILAADSALYGSRPILGSMEFLMEALLTAQAGASATDIVEAQVRLRRGKFSIVGFSRPIAKGDERVELLRKKARALDMQKGPYEELAMRIHDYAESEYGESINMNGFIAAVSLDQGFSAKEVYQLSSAAVLSGVEACFVDYEDRQLGSFLPLRCDDVEYIGPAKRSVERPIK